MCVSNYLNLCGYFKGGSVRIPRCLTNSSIDHLHISVSILTLLVFSDFSWELLPFNADKRVNFLQSSMKIINIFPIFCIKFKWCSNLWIFYLIWKDPLIFYNVQISINFMKFLHLYNQNLCRIHCSCLERVPFCPP